MLNLISSLGGRRFIMAMLIGLATTLLTYLGKIDGGIYATVILGTIGAYITGNTYQKVKSNESVT